jgi:predicted heme/steroid binding protein
MNPITQDVNFDTTTRPLYATSQNERIDALNHRGIIRTDTNEMIGIVGGRYKVVDHKRSIEQTGEAISRFSPNYSVSHNVEGGRVFTKFKLEDLRAFDGNQNEQAYIAVNLYNSYDRSISQVVSFSVWRMVCSNGMYGFANEFRERKLHTQSLNIAKMTEHLESSIESYLKKYENFQQQLVGKKIIKAEILEKTLGERLVKNARDNYRVEKAITGVDDAWTQYNAFTRTITHNDKISESRRQELSRTVSSLFLANAVVAV